VILRIFQSINDDINICISCTIESNNKLKKNNFCSFSNVLNVKCKIGHSARFWEIKRAEEI